MTSLLRTLQAEWNSLVPAAQARGIPRIRLLNLPLETIAYRKAKLDWLKAQLTSTIDFAGWTFGVEIECIMPRGQDRWQVAQAITAAGVTCTEEHLSHGIPTTWKVVYDGSLSNRGCEVVSPPLTGEEGLNQLRKVCKALTAIRCKISRRCGFHVHVGAAAQGLGFFKNLVRLYSSAEKSIDRFLSPSRTNNVYCHSIRVNGDSLEAATTLADVARAVGQDHLTPRGAGRYCKINLQSFWSYGTVEFRQHEGTVEAPKAEYWVRLCLRMCMTAAKELKTPATLPDLMDAVEAPAVEREYFANRTTHFARRAA